MRRAGEGSCEWRGLGTGRPTHESNPTLPFARCFLSSAICLLMPNILQPLGRDPQVVASWMHLAPPLLQGARQGSRQRCAAMSSPLASGSAGKLNKRYSFQRLSGYGTPCRFLTSLLRRVEGGLRRPASGFGTAVSGCCHHPGQE